MVKSIFLYFILLSSVIFGQQKIVTRINSGGPTVTVNNVTWLSDKFYVSGGTYTTTIQDDLNPVYKDVRHGQFSYDIPVPNGKYKVVLHFTEVFANYPNRTFNVSLNDNVVLSNFNVFVEAGNLPNVPVVKTFEVETSNLSGINLKFTPGTKSAIVDAIEVYSAEVEPVIWCPGPVLSRVDDKNFIVGANWTKEKPCHVNFNIQNGSSALDPISVQTFDSPFILSVDSAFTGSDQIYVWVSFPNPLINDGKSSIVVTTNTLGLVSCNGSLQCSTTAQQTIPRTFPYHTSPIGTFDVLDGKLAVKPNNIMDGNRQITIGPNASAIIEITDGVMMIQIEPVLQMKLAIEQNAAMQREMINFQVDRARLDVDRIINEAIRSTEYINMIVQKVKGK